MNTPAQYDKLCAEMADRVISRYSTTFRLAVLVLHPRFRSAVRSIYAFVRLADEIVDTFHDQDRDVLLERFRRDTGQALAERFSLHPVLHHFQHTAHRYGIGAELIGPFLHSMAMDLERNFHDEHSFREYVHGSAEVVGLMCLKVFCAGDDAAYERLKAPAARLGAAFQKVNFLRDLQDDRHALGRSYFPGVGSGQLDRKRMEVLMREMEGDLEVARSGIRLLPRGTRFGVYLAYAYNRALLRRIGRSDPGQLHTHRIRLNEPAKMGLLATSFLRYRLHLY